MMFSRISAPASSLVIGVAALWLVLPAVAHEETESEPAAIAIRNLGELVDFARDIQPIFEEKCIECHGPDEAKNDFRMDDAETVLSYIEPGDLESSSLWTDYLVTDDPDMRMPPPAHHPAAALSGAQLGAIKLWIEEGAPWPEPILTDVSPVALDAVESVPASLPARMWIFQGLFHPATVHFPIALLTVSAGFVFLSFFKRNTCEPVAFHCLWIGALGAIISSMAGWAYAVHEGYGSGFSFDLQDSAIDRHRWLGIGVAVIALILVPMAASVRRTGDLGMRFLWLIGALVMAVAVAIAGFQGGELSYGENHYWMDFERLFPAVSEIPDEDEELAVDADTEEDTRAEPESKDSGEIESSADASPLADAPLEDNTSVEDATQSEVPNPEPSAAKDTVGDEPAVDNSAVEEPAVDEPTVDEPTVDEPAVDEPAVDEIK